MGKLSGAGELVLDDLQTLCALGLAGSRTDGQLIALFLGNDQQTSERAFRVLVERHGPMVLGVCHRILSDRYAAEDALQATFLVLAKRARSIRRQESVGGWLHRVARRIAVRAGKAARRRRSILDIADHAETLAELRDPGQSLERSELRNVLDNEIDRLGSSSRQVVVLCDLEGLTYDQAAERLRWPVGTVKSRLSRARVRLRERLVRRGYGPAILGGAGALWGDEATAALSSPQVQAVVKTALTGLAGTSGVPTMVASLAGDELRVGAAIKLRFVVSMVLLLGGSAATWAFSGDRNPPPRQQVKPLAFRGPGEKAEAAGNDASNAPRKVSAAGKVVDAQGRPVAKARVFLREWANRRTRNLTIEEVKNLRRAGKVPDILAEAETDANGSFHLAKIDAPTFSKSADNSYLGTTWFPWDLVILAEGHGLAWVRLTPQNQREALTITLPKEASLRGRVTTVDGKPIKGATVRVDEITGLGARIRETRSDSTEERLNLSLSSVPLDTKTDDEGRFVLHGLVPERRFSLVVQGAGFQPSPLFAATTEKRPPDLEDQARYDRRIQTRLPILTGDFAVTLKEANHQLSGRVVFESTGKPAVGAFVLLKYDSVGPTDQDGRFTAKDLVAGTIDLHVAAKGNDSAPLDMFVEIPEDKKVVEQTFRLPRGLVVSGRVVDDQGAGVEGAELRYRASPDAKGIRTRFALTAMTDAKGGFQLGVPAGPGMIMVTEVPENYLGPQMHWPFDSGLGGENTRFIDGASGTVIGDLKFSLSRSGRITVQALDTDGRPVEGAEVRRYALASRQGKPLLTNAEGRAEVVGLDPKGVYTIDLVHPTKRLGRRLEISVSEAREAKEGVQAKLAPLGSLEGRVLDENDKPLLNPILWLRTNVKIPEPFGIAVESRNEVKEDGSFRFQGLIPGASYYVYAEVAGRASENSKAIIAKADARERLEPFRLPVTHRTLTGVVVDSRGQPVKNAIVVHELGLFTLSSYHESSPARTETDEAGRFKFTELPRGELWISAYGPSRGADRFNWKRVRENVGANQTDVRLVLPESR